MSFSFDKIKRFINSKTRILVSNVKKPLINYNNWIVERQIYIQVLSHFANILFGGVVLWIIILPFGKKSLWYVLSYGLMLWLPIHYAKSFKEELKK